MTQKSETPPSRLADILNEYTCFLDPSLNDVCLGGCVDSVK
jgi:hypothetical protein